MGTFRNCVSAMTFRPFTLICGLALLASCAGLPVDDEQKEDSVLAVFNQAAKNQVQEQIQEDSVNDATDGGEEVLDQESVRVDSERTFEAHHGPGNSFPTCLRPGFGEVALKYGRREHYYNACTPHHRGGWINKGHVMAVDKSCCASGQVKCTGTSGKYTWGDGANKNIGDASSPYACMWDFQCMPGPGTTAGGCSGYYKRSSPRQGQNRNSLPQIKRLDRSNQRNTNMAAEVAACKSVCDAASDCDSFIYRSHEGSSNWRGSRYGHHHCWFFGPPPSGWKLDPETTGLVGQWDHWYTKCDGSGAL